MRNVVNSENPPQYGNAAAMTSRDANTVKRAIKILESRLENNNVVITSPGETRDYLFLQSATEECEYFSVLFLDTRHRVIAYERLFRGTIDGASVHPRELVKRALQVNAAAVIVSHNHPSGNPEPSQADIRLTKRLTDSLALVDIKVLDHMIIGNTAVDSISLAERGII